MIFSEGFFQALVYGALIWTAIGGAGLITLMIKDAKGKNLW